MKVVVKTLKGSHFEIDVQPDDKVADVKKAIETAQGQNVYPADQQMLIHQGKILKDDTTLQENKVSDNSFIVIMLSKTKSTSSGASSTTTAPTSQAPSANPVHVNPPNPASAPTQSSTATAALEPSTAPTPAVIAPAAPVTPSSGSADVYGQAASNLVAGSNLDSTIQHILDMGGGTWDRDIVVRALRAAYNNPERAVEYLYTGIPAQAEAPPAAQSPASGQAATSPSPVQASQPANPVPLSGGPNTNPLDLFPQNLPNAGSNTGAGAGILDLVRNSPQFQNLQNMVQANPQILQPMLRELGRQNPQFLNLIQEHQDELLQMMSEPASGGAEGNIFSQLAAAMPQAVTVTPEERESIERLEAMGFDRELVLQVFFACNKDEELAANYLADHIHEFDDMNE